MTDALKALIDNAQIRTVGYFSKLMFVSNGIYDGFYGINGYDNILILGLSDGEWWKVSEYGEKFDIYQDVMSLNIDIPTEYGVPCIWFHSPVFIDNSLGLSSVVGGFKRKQRKGEK